MRQTFVYRGQELPYLLSGHNCYHAHVGQHTERIVEIPIADHWLKSLGEERVIEVGAVTPYYWPQRVLEIIDPYDKHPLVTQKKRIQDVDLLGQNVLSVSTFEHLGKKEYDQPEEPDIAWRELARLAFGSKRFLATWPTGYNEHLDAFAMNFTYPGVVLTCLVREDKDWTETKPTIRPYGPFGNAIFIMEKEYVYHAAF